MNPLALSGPLTEPGAYRMPAAEYHADPAPRPSLSSSLASILLERSPAHAAARHPRLTDPVALETTRNMDFGSAMHELLLGGEVRVVTVNAPDWRTRAARASREEIRKACGIPVLAGDWPRMARMLAAAREQLARAGMAWAFSPARGFSEVSAFWQEEAAGAPIWGRARFDWIDPQSGLILDYKTTSMPLSMWKRRALMELPGRVQPAWYRRAAGRLGVKRPRFAFVVQETVEPFGLMVFEPGPRLLERGRADIDHAAASWSRCLGRGEWPGYPAKVETMEPPAPRKRSNPLRKGRRWAKSR